MQPFYAGSSCTHTWTIEEVTQRLSQQSAVLGVVMMGSGGGGKLSPHSDIDLCVVLQGELCQAAMVSTTIQGRLAEVYFVQMDILQAQFALRQELTDGSFELARLSWLQNGEVLFDRQGRLNEMKVALMEVPGGRAAGESRLYADWYATNYDLVQTRRLVEAEDMPSQMKVDLRLLRMLHELWERYFRLRGLPAMSEKRSALWLEQNDPLFLADFQACLAEMRRGERFALYVRLAQHALQPAGGLWPEEMTAVQLSEGGLPETAKEAVQIWEGWFA